MAGYQKISDAQIESESKFGYKPLSVESGVSLLPFSELGDREFEYLAYMLLKSEIKTGEESRFTDISLMQGVGDRGRDCVLYRDQIVVGVVQCKKCLEKVTRPLVLKELGKFLLFALLDESILPEPDNFEYMFYVSGDFNEPAKKLIHSFQLEVRKEIEIGNIKKYIESLVTDYDSFKQYRVNPPVAEVIGLMERIKVSSSNVIELTNRVNRYQNILEHFFRVQPVISLEGADVKIRKALEDYGVRLLTDEDLKDLGTRIGSVDEKNRHNWGFVDFFGYSRDFFKYLQGDKLRKIVDAIAELMVLLNKELLDFLILEIRRFIYEKITVELLNRGRIHPFSVTLASPYLLDRLTPAIVIGAIPKSMLNKLYPQCSMTKEENIKKISSILIESSERIMAKDYSELLGSPSDIEYKVQLFAYLHHGFRTIDDAKKVLSRDLEVMMPVLDKIEAEIVSKMPPLKRTIVIKDADFFDDEGQLKRLVESIQRLEK